MSSLFLNSERQLRDGWWLLIFFLVLASLLVPALVIAQQNSIEVSVGVQAMIVGLTTFACQLLRRQPLTEITGTFDKQWYKDLALGGLFGSALMLLPTLILKLCGWVDLEWNPVGLSSQLSSFLLFAGVAVAEELLFRGFMFQRLISGLGVWPAQLITAAFFLLTHLDNPGMLGSVRVMASVNIFLSSIMFGLAFIRTKSLAMPLAMHGMANWIQGGVLGFGVSGTGQSGLWKPILSEVPAWVTGGQFGLEASVFGLVCLLAMLLVIHKRVTHA